MLLTLFDSFMRNLSTILALRAVWPLSKDLLRDLENVIRLEEYVVSQQRFVMSKDYTARMVSRKAIRGGKN